MRIDVKKTEFLNNVYVQSFNDNYHSHNDEASSELEKEARKIRRRYRRYTDYTAAYGVYTEYMSQLIQKHGGYEMFKIKLKGGVIREFIPAKPRLKATAKNKIMEKNRIVISEIDMSKTDMDEVVAEAKKRMDYDVNVLYVPVVEGGDKYDKIIDESLKGNPYSFSRKQLQDINNLDFIEEYFLKKNEKERLDKKEKESKTITLAQLMSGDYEDDNDTSDKDEVIFYKGRYLTREAVEELQLYDSMSELGWNSLKLMKNKSGNKKIAKILKEEEKHKKKKNKKKNKRKGKGSFMEVVIGDNYDSFEQFEEEMLNFNMSNIFKM